MLRRDVINYHRGVYSSSMLAVPAEALNVVFELDVSVEELRGVSQRRVNVCVSLTVISPIADNPISPSRENGNEIGGHQLMMRLNGPSYL
jgi:hypothetical protein